MIIHSLQIMRKTNFGLAPTFNHATSDDIIKMIKFTSPSISTLTLSHSTPISVAEQALHYVLLKIKFKQKIFQSQFFFNLIIF